MKLNKILTYSITGTVFLVGAFTVVWLREHSGISFSFVTAILTAAFIGAIVGLINTFVRGDSPKGGEGNIPKDVAVQSKKLPIHPALIITPIGIDFCYMLYLLGSGTLLSADTATLRQMELFETLITIGWLVLQLIFLHRMWQLVQTSDLNIKKPTPGKAVGFVFIPFYNLYWWFILWRNLGLHANHLTPNRNVPVMLVTVGCGLFLAKAFLSTLHGGLALVFTFLYFAGQIILLISNFYFYNSAKLLISIIPEQADESPEAIENVQYIREPPERVKGESMNPEALEHLRLGAHFLVEGELDAAINEFQETIKLDPHCAEAHHGLGDAYRRMGLYDQAISSFREAIQLDHNCAEAHLGLGVAYSGKGLQDLEIEHFEKAIKLDPNCAEAYSCLGVAYHNKGMPEIAIKRYEEAIRLTPDIAVDRYNLGLAYTDMDLGNLAILQFEEAIRLKPDFAEAHGILGVMYGENGLYDRALKQFEHVIKLTPEDAKAHFGLGVTYTEKGQHDEAIRHVEQALRIEPDYPTARELLQTLYQKKQGG